MTVMKDTVKKLDSHHALSGWSYSAGGLLRSRQNWRPGCHGCGLALAGVVVAAVLTVIVAACSGRSGQPVRSGRQADTATPIHHLVVLFPENVSFDHYFGSYP